MKKRGRKTATNRMGSGGSQMDNHNGNEDVDDTEAEEEEDDEEDKEEDKSEDEVKEGYAHTSSQHGVSKILATISRPTKRARSGNNKLDAGATVEK